MDKINFQNLPNTTTPINATNLNQVQTNVENAINSVNTDVTNLQTEVSTKSTYSTTETVVGTWINGKPLYRKVIETNSTGTQAHGISNIDTITNVSGMAYFSENSPGYGWQPIPRNVPANNEAYGIGIGNIRASEFTLIIGSSYTSFSKANIVFEYTKTTD